MCRHLLTGNLSGLCRVQGLLSLASLFSGLRWQSCGGYFWKGDPFQIHDSQRKISLLPHNSEWTLFPLPFPGVYLVHVVKLPSGNKYLLWPTEDLINFWFEPCSLSGKISVNFTSAIPNDAKWFSWNLMCWFFRTWDPFLLSMIQYGNLSWIEFVLRCFLVIIWMWIRK